jgi:uncharacterized protein with HEPN domain
MTPADGAGEAAGRVSPGTRDRYPAIPWLDISEMRNRLTHGDEVLKVYDV